MCLTWAWSFVILHIICRGKRHRASLLVRLVCTCVHPIMVELEKSKNKLQEDANARGRWICTGNWGYLLTTCTVVPLGFTEVFYACMEWQQLLWNVQYSILKQLGLPADVPAIHKSSKTNFTREVTFHRDSWQYDTIYCNVIIMKLSLNRKTIELATGEGMMIQLSMPYCTS